MSIFDERVEYFFQFFKNNGYDDLSVENLAFTCDRFGPAVIKAAYERVKNAEPGILYTPAIKLKDRYGEDIELGFVLTYRYNRLHDVQVARFNDIRQTYITLSSNYYTYASEPFAEPKAFFLAGYDDDVMHIANQLIEQNLIEEIPGAGKGQYGLAKLTQYRVTDKGMVYFMGDEFIDP